MLVYNSNNLRTVRSKIYIAFFFHGINSWLSYIIICVFLALDYTIIVCVDYVLGQGLGNK